MVQVSGWPVPTTYTGPTLTSDFFTVTCAILHLAEENLPGRDRGEAS